MAPTSAAVNRGGSNGDTVAQGHRDQPLGTARRDLERSKRFYIDVLGFEDRTSRVNPGQAMSSNPTMCFLLAGSQGLDLFQVPTNDVYTNDVYGGREMSHMALSVEAEDIDDVLGLLEAAGVPVSDKTPRNSVFISDPDGHRIEILPRSANPRVLIERAPRDAEQQPQ